MAERIDILGIKKPAAAPVIEIPKEVPQRPAGAGDTVLVCYVVPRDNTEANASGDVLQLCRLDVCAGTREGLVFGNLFPHPRTRLRHPEPRMVAERVPAPTIEQRFSYQYSTRGFPGTWAWPEEIPLDWRLNGYRPGIGTQAEVEAAILQTELEQARADNKIH